MSSESAAEAELKVKARAVSECMLSNSMGAVAGVAVGTYLGIRRKHLRPFVYAITIGTFADMVYGYTNNCRPLINDYMAAKKHLSVPQLQEVLVEVPHPSPAKKSGEKH